MKKLIILFLFICTALGFSKNAFDVNNTWLLDTGNENYRIIYKGVVNKEISVNDAEHNPPDVLSGGIVSYKNINIVSNEIRLTKLNSGYAFLDSIKNPVLLPLDSNLKNADFLEIRSVSGDFTAVLPGKEYKKIKVFKISTTKTAVQYGNITFIFPNNGYIIEASENEWDFS